MPRWMEAVARERQLQSRASSKETPQSIVERAVEVSSLGTRAGVPQKSALAANVREPVFKKKDQKLKRIQKNSKI